MRALENANSLLMFLLELGVLAAVGYWGLTLATSLWLRILVAVGGIAVFVTVWALFGAAADATYPAEGIWRAALEIGWFGGGATALALAGRTTLAVIFAVLFIINAALRLYWK
ncbi:YrdB family protein [Stackebrandtia nassauensis]|uniref:DUF2568 domain-containing protein n=1 Tax=Stackebrandtia nassauensis (strain DSM 44728 / CIP 108903 / NRRL B-16338 / NBRC 102104 / LLR-40K-21) TaxID=446470 RepID=D3Q3G1_STANL|nr:YrdB family protein [Stackebrandtia nassauensis]ADD42002.1 conserved hypothetical protein [Stackebrandtia nassauensis DSM 44728]